MGNGDTSLDTSAASLPPTPPPPSRRKRITAAIFSKESRLTVGGALLIGTLLVGVATTAVKLSTSSTGTVKEMVHEGVQKHQQTALYIAHPPVSSNYVTRWHLEQQLTSIKQLLERIQLQQNAIIKRLDRRRRRRR